MSYDCVRKEVIELATDLVMRYYPNFDDGHNTDHAFEVMQNSMKISSEFMFDDVRMEEMILMAAALHDIGLGVGREFHHLESERLVLQNLELPKLFSGAEIKIIADACRQHRASSPENITSLVSKIVSDADLLTSLTGASIIRRAIAAKTFANPTITRDKLYAEVLELLHDKFGKCGYAKLHLSKSEEMATHGKKEIEAMIYDIDLFDSEFNRLYLEHQA